MVATGLVNSTTGENIKEGFLLASDAPYIPGSLFFGRCSASTLNMFYKHPPSNTTRQIQIIFFQIL
jgi:hypothetical protein